MDHAVNIRVSLEDLVKVFLLPDVHFHEFRALAGNQLDSIDDLFAGVVKVVA